MGKHSRRGVTPDWRRMKREGFLTAMESDRRLFERDGNPHFVWNAYRMVHAAGIVAPEWVTEQVAAVAARLSAMEGEKGNGPHTYAEALGVATKGGSSKAMRAAEARRDADIRDRLHVLRHRPTADHIRQVAERAGLRAPELPERGKVTNEALYRQVAEESRLSIERVKAIDRRREFTNSRS